MKICLKKINNFLLKSLLFIILVLNLSCGKKTDIEPPADYKRPKFDNMIDE